MALSLRARLVYGLFRHAHWFRFRRERLPFDASPQGLSALRRRTDRPSPLFGSQPKNLILSSVAIQGRIAERMVPLKSQKTSIMLYLHGGMYLCGHPTAHRGIVAKFVRATGLAALVPDYRLAPEHPYPAALDDALAAYRFLLDEGHLASEIILVGDSAGGGLALALLLALKERGLPLPAAAAALSPWTDLTLSGDSHRSQAEACLSPPGCAQAASAAYAGSHPTDLPLISPLWGDLSGLPSLFLSVGSAEILRDDTLRFADKARAAGTTVQVLVGEGLFHCYPVCAPIFPEASQALAQVTGFIRHHASG